MADTLDTILVDGSPVVKDDLRGFLNARLARSHYGLNGVIHLDRTGLVDGDGVPAVYVPRAIYVQSPGIDVTGNYGTAHAKITTHAKFTYGTDAAFTVAFDTAALAFVSYGWNDTPPSPSAGLLHICTVFNRGVTSEFPYFWTDGQQGTAWADVANGPIVHDVSTGELLIPPLQGHDGAGNSWTLDKGTDGALFRTVQVPNSSGSALSIWVDTLDIAANGASSPTALRSDASWPPVMKADTPFCAVLGYAYAGRFMARFGQQIEYLRNECPYTADDNDLAEFHFDTTVAQDNTDAEAKLTYPRGWADLTNNRPYYGGRFQTPLHAGWVFVRLHVTTPTPGSFGSPVAYLLDALVTPSPFGGLQIEKVISTTHRIYCGWLYRDQSSTPMIGLWAGVDSAPAGIMIFGLQYAVGSTRNIWVNRVDAPRYGELPGDRDTVLGGRISTLEGITRISAGDFDPLPPRTLAGIAGLTLPLYPGQMFGNVVEGRYAVSLVSPGSGVGVFTQKSEGGSLRIAPLQSSTDTLIFRDKSLAVPSLWNASVATRVAPKAAVAGLSPRVHFLGDSLTQFAGGANLTAARMAEISGVAPRLVGTMNVSCDTWPGVATCLAEGRGGRQYIDYINQTGNLQTVASGGEAAYLALSDYDKLAWNPCVSPATSNDTANRAAMVKNGWIYDPAVYLSRFGLATPEVVVINLGTNDESLAASDAAALTAVQTGLPIMVSQWRRLFPNTTVILALNCFGLETGNRWGTRRRNTARYTQGYVAGLGTSKVLAFAGFAHISREFGFRTTTNGTDSQTGVAAQTVSDNIHYGAYGIAEYADALAQMILAVAAGY